jgi:hypothetical protein
MTYSTFGTPTFQAEPIKFVRVADVSFREKHITLTLTDGRAIQLDMTKFA